MFALLGKKRVSLHEFFSMNTTALKQVIAHGISDLPEESLQEVADFVLFLRAKKISKVAFSEIGLADYIQRELSALREAELSHVEEEFVGYQKKYPVE